MLFKKSVSPVVASLLLVTVAIVIGVYTFNWYYEYTGDVTRDISEKEYSKDIRTEYAMKNRIYGFSEYNNFKVDKVLIDGIECNITTTNETFSKGTFEVGFDESCTEDLEYSMNEILIITDKGSYKSMLSITNALSKSESSYSGDTDGGDEDNNDCSADYITYNGYTFSHSSLVNGQEEKLEYFESISDGSIKHSIEVICEDSIVNYIDQTYEKETICDGGFEVNGDTCQKYFISLWDTTKTTSGSSQSNQITLPLEETGTYDFIVDWGDGNSDTIKEYNQDEVTHTYSNEGEYEIKISGTIKGFRFNNDGDRNKILNITQYGPLNLGNSGSYFMGAENLDISATDELDLSGTTSFVGIFRSASSFNGNLSSWDTSGVTNMSNMFYGADSFNGDISSWDVSSVADMSNMFYGADSFNGDISSWDVSNVINMKQMFLSTREFNQDISSWDVSNVINMDYIFVHAGIIEQDLSSWDVSKVTSCNTFDLYAIWDDISKKPNFTNCNPN